LRSHLFAITLLLLLATWLGARGLNADPIWIDEYWSIYNAGGAHYGPLSPAEIFTRISTEDIWHVPFYYLIIAGWGSLVGWTHTALRVLSLLFGVLSIAMVYRLGRDLYSPLAGLGAAVAVGASAYYLYYFHELRGYTLNVLLSEIVLWSYWQTIQRQSRYTLLVFFLSTLAILYTHYLAALVLVALGLYHLLFVRKDRLWWHLTGAAVIAGILFLPWVSVTLRAWREASAPDNVALRDWGPGALELNALLIYVFGNGTLALPLIAAWFALANNRVRAAFNAACNRGGDKYGWFLLIALLILAFVLNMLISLFVVMRYLLPIWGILGLLVGIGVARMSQYRRLPTLFLVVWAVSSIWSSLDPQFISRHIDTRLLSHTPWHQIAPQLAERMEQGDIAAFLLPDETWWVWQDWVHGFYLHEVQERGLNTQLVESYPQTPDRDYRRDAREFTTPRLWVGYHTNNQPLAWWTYSEALIENYAFCPAPILLEDYQLDLYTRIPQNPSYQFGDQVGISLVEPLRIENGILQTTLGVAVGTEIDLQAYSVALHVMGSGETPLAQTDFGLLVPDSPLAYRCDFRQIDISPLTSGEYTLYALVYEWQTDERLPVVGMPENRLPLGVFRIP
jgi:hypothetical protein